MVSVKLIGAMPAAPGGSAAPGSDPASSRAGQAGGDGPDDGDARLVQAEAPHQRDADTPAGAGSGESAAP